MRAPALMVLAATLAAAAPARAAGPLYTLAGDGLGHGRLATDRRFAEVSLVAVDGRGDLAFSDSLNDRIRVVSPRGALSSLPLIVPVALTLTARGVPIAADEVGIFAFRNGHKTLFAGTSHEVPASPGAIGDGQPARRAALELPGGLALAPDGSVYVADSWHHRVRRIGPGGTIDTVAGTGGEEASGDGGPARGAGLASPDAVAVAADGSVLVVDAGRLRRITPQGTIEAVPALLASVFAVVAAPDGGAYVIDTDGDVLRLAPDGGVTRVAGTGTPGFSGDGGPATQAQIGVTSLALAPGGGLLLADGSANRIRRIGPDGVIETIAGTGVAGHVGDGGPATQAELESPGPIAVAPDGGILLLDNGQDGARVRRIAPDGTIATLAGAPLTAADLPPGTALDSLRGLVALPDGGFLLTDANAGRVFRAPPGGRPLTTFAGGGDPTGDGGPALGAAVGSGPLAAADGSVFVGDEQGVRRISPNGTIETRARVAGARAIAVAPGGAILVSTGRRVLRSDGHGVRTLAGNGRDGVPREGARAMRTPLDATSLAALPHGAFAAVTLSGALVRVAHGRIHTLVAPQIGVYVRAVAAEPGGGIVYADRGTVRYLPPRHPRRLAVTVRGRHAVATLPARVGLDWYRGARRIANPRAPGLYRVRAWARRGARRASSWSSVVLGGRLPVRPRLLGDALQATPEVTASAADELPFRQLTSCRRHGPRRIGCEIDVGDNYPIIDCAAVGEVVLGRDGIVRARETECGPPALKRRPPWLGPLVVADLLA